MARRIIKWYFVHGKTPLLSINGKGAPLPEMTELILQVDTSQNHSGAPSLRDSYKITDPFGLAIGCCHWCHNLVALGECLSTLCWQEAGQPEVPTNIVVTKIIHSDFHFTEGGDLFTRRPAGMRDSRPYLSGGEYPDV